MLVLCFAKFALEVVHEPRVATHSVHSKCFQTGHSDCFILFNQTSIESLSHLRSYSHCHVGLQDFDIKSTLYFLTKYFNCDFT